MRRLILVAALVVSAMSAQSVQVAGRWTGEMRQKQPNGDVVRGRLVFVLQQAGEHVIGMGGSAEDPDTPIRDARLEGDRLTFFVPATAEDGPTWKFDLRASGHRMAGRGEGSRGNQSLGSTEVAMNRSAIVWLLETI